MLGRRAVERCGQRTGLSLGDQPVRQEARERIVRSPGDQPVRALHRSVAGRYAGAGCCAGCWAIRRRGLRRGPRAAADSDEAPGEAR
jgi:hypothetical protein